MRVPLSWLAEFVRPKLRPAQLAHRLTMAGLEVEAVHAVADDTVLELGVTPNRPDWLSIVGVAREVAAVTGARLRTVIPQPSAGAGAIAKSLRVMVKATAQCPRYCARLVHGVSVGPSPAFVQARLVAAGMRPINNVVDATNYVLWELGQPLHAFDARFVRGGRIVVRRAGNAASFTTLDGVARALVPEDLLICDAESPVALAGIMGGANSEVRPDTTDIILESAWFAPQGIRRTAKRLGLTTESSRRFERGVDPAGVLTALQRVVELICEWAGGTPSRDWIDRTARPIKPQVVVLPLGEVERLLGVAIPPAIVRSCLTRLGCVVRGATRTQLRVQVPTHRPDLMRPVDLVEELARLHGYDKIVPVCPAHVPAPLHRPPDHALQEQCAERLQALGFSESIHYAFLPAATADTFAMPHMRAVPIANPLGNEPSALKTTLVSGLVQAAAHNFRNGRTLVRLFELRRVFSQGDEGIQEGKRLALVMGGQRHPFGWTQAQDMLDFFDLKGVVETVCHWASMAALQWVDEGVPAFLHPGVSSYLFDNKECIGFCGELHPAVAKAMGIESPLYLAELDWDALARRALAHQATYQPVPRFPGVRRDVALLMPKSLPSEKVVATIHDSGEKWIQHITVFDVYEGDRLPAAKKSVAYAIQYQDRERTLTDDEVNAVHGRVVALVVGKLGVEVRS